MKRTILMFIIIFSLIIVNSLEYVCYSKEDSFNKIEKIMLEDYEFVENGLKIEYTVDSSIQEEKDRIENVFTNDLKLELSKDVYSMSALDDGISYDITLYKEDVTRVQIIILNENRDLQIADLKQLGDKIKSSNCINQRFFTFVKGKLRVNDGVINDKIYEQIEKDTIKSLDINNGSVLKATLRDKQNVNIGQIHYNTGSYLIIGTPIIFVTY